MKMIFCHCMGFARIWVGVLCLVWAVVAFAAAKKEVFLYDHGKKLYEDNCKGCHGANGDSSAYPGITPLPGITMRVSTPYEMSKISARFINKTFVGEDASALYSYIGALKGEKGFENPGFLISPYYLHLHCQDVDGFRIIDARSKEDYEANHIRNAFSWDFSSAGEENSVEQALKRLGVKPDTFIVVYDQSGGLDATSIWRRIFQYGHTRIAALDGGFDAWMKGNYPVTQTSPLALQSRYPKPNPPNQPAIEMGEIKDLYLGGQPDSSTGICFQWRETIGDSGLKPADEIRAYFQKEGIQSPSAYRVCGSMEELSFFVYLNYLLGNEPVVTTKEQTVVCLRGDG